MSWLLRFWHYHPESRVSFYSTGPWVSEIGTTILRQGQERARYNASSNLMQGPCNELSLQVFFFCSFINYSKIDNTIKVDLVNSDPKKNYFRKNDYNGLIKAYLRKEIALKLSKAQNSKQQGPWYQWNFTTEGVHEWNLLENYLNLPRFFYLCTC